MGELIEGNPEGARLQYSSSVAPSVRGGSFWDEPVDDGMLFRFVDLRIEQPGWVKVIQSNLNVSCVSAGKFASSFFQHGDADTIGSSLRVFMLNEQRSQIITFSRPCRYRVVQLCFTPERATKILSGFSQEPLDAIRTLKAACHIGKMFAVRNFMLPGRVAEIVDSLLARHRLSPNRRLNLYAKAIEILGEALDVIAGAEAQELLHSRKIARIETASRILSTNLAEPLDLAALAEQVQLGPDTLQRNFRARFGTSLRAFQAKCRMNVAGNLLCNTEMSISEIGRAVGFSNHAAFSRAYLRYFGRTPSSERALSPRVMDGSRNGHGRMIRGRSNSSRSTGTT